MHCPYCRTPLVERSPECPGCRLDLDRAAALLGPLPPIAAGVSDADGLFRKGARRRLLKRIDTFERRFPQVRFQLLCRRLPAEHPFELYVFWLFNLGNFAAETEKDGDNRGILLALDPEAGRSALMPGYGLEPFLAVSTLDDILATGDAAFRQKRWTEGVLTILNALDGTLARASTCLDDWFAPPPSESPATSF